MTKEDVLKLTPLEIRELMAKKSAEIEKLDRKIDKLEEEMVTIEDNCPHVNVAEKRGSDMYMEWYINYKCEDCGKEWNTFKWRNGEVENN